MITKTTKTNYAQKKVSFSGNGLLTDENGEVIDLMQDLQRIYVDVEFDITVSNTDSKKMQIDDFAPVVEDEDEIFE